MACGVPGRRERGGGVSVRECEKPAAPRERGKPTPTPTPALFMIR
eukprot:CAMPEP_0119199522 /NCGR_PEP_ID=MMETSP1316-20130426/22962_1 /TAXON_ID=41880 /ORGANISM="Pycnococcus provasolii, Strain RCC2336" /LENGTH=44 /DNA_ID= /DNA_START= /DNA_END= /DNA_ORIENTATION=